MSEQMTLYLAIGLVAFFVGGAVAVFVCRSMVYRAVQEMQAASCGYYKPEDPEEQKRNRKAMDDFLAKK